jgi:hypothetical protein
VLANVVPPSAGGLRDPRRGVVVGRVVVLHALGLGGDLFVVVIFVFEGGCTMTVGNVGRRLGGRGGEKSWIGENQRFHDGGRWSRWKTSAMQITLNRRGRISVRAVKILDFKAF